MSFKPHPSHFQATSKPYPSHFQAERVGAHATLIQGTLTRPCHHQYDPDFGVCLRCGKDRPIYYDDGERETRDSDLYADDLEFDPYEAEASPY